MPSEFISALGLIKWSAALTNEQLGLISKKKSKSIQKAAQNLIDGDVNEEFLVDVFQTGSGTSSNMNANEVIASIASLLTDEKVHPNDDVNMSQSSNDVVPTAISVAAMIRLKESLLPALNNIISSLGHKSDSLQDVVKTGRTHISWTPCLSHWLKKLMVGNINFKKYVTESKKVGSIILSRARIYSCWNRN